MLAMTKEMSPEHREIIQQYVNEAFGRFKDIVKLGRPRYRERPVTRELVYMGSFMPYKNVETLALALHVLPDTGCTCSRRSRGATAGACSNSRLREH